ncbi:peroxisomal membrane protein PEX17 [Achaetomium macrosporum]|uniref:Peroxisomal membrane protein PEX17 n=1 Tax=Achaetomium macrosporum TaxID=79813 RepID=A0AAN7HIC3_9PEZI|nr:peroxisomal membrane protein PEX17 [Achaetomium macrosporum]
MSIDRLLTTVLQLYQDVHDDARTEQIYGSTTVLLTNLSNPLNVSLLTSQLLTAPAIWGRRDGLRACYRIISIYNTAAIHVRRNELENAKNKGQPRAGGVLGSDAWTAAVLKGADDQSGRWQHLLVFSGVLMGMESGNRHSLSRGMRATVERAVVTAANLALRIRAPEPPAPSGPVALALNYVFPLLSESARAGLDCDALVPVATRAMLGGDGLQDGLFLATIDQDVRQSEQKFMWADNSPSCLHLKQLEQKPLISGLGPLSRLLAHGVQHARDSGVVLQLQDDLLAFTERLLQYWQANKLSELEISEEELFLTPETLKGTWPALWQFLKKVMYAVVAVLQAVVARSLIDRNLKRYTMAPAVAAKTLHTLRNLYFISSRNGSDAFQVYTFTYLTSLDTLARYGPACASFLREINPSLSSPSPTSIPAHPLHRTLDLFYLNVSEHLPLNLSPAECDTLIIQPAITYLNHPSGAPLSPRMLELFEAAHSAVLSVLSCPHNAPLAVDIVPFYAEALFSSFPTHISPRQFRLAFKTVMQILSPPFPPSASHPHLAETLLEMVRFRVTEPGVGRVALPPSPGPSLPNATPVRHEELVSEQSTLVLTLIDSLPFLQLAIFEEWMTLAAYAVHEIGDGALREVAQRRFWDVLANGEMDVERAAIALAWWGTRGGREAVLFGVPARGGARQPELREGEGDVYMMSGAIPPAGPVVESKL